MIEKIKNALHGAAEKLVNALPKVEAQDSMMVIFAYAALIGCISVAFMGAWIYDGIHAGKFDTELMLRFFSEATSPVTVAAITGISIFLVDKDKDGRPDVSAQKAEKGETK